MDRRADPGLDDRQAQTARPERARGEKAIQYRLTVVTRPGAGLGFRMAGVPVEEMAEASAAARIAALLEEPDLGVLAVEDDLLQHVPESVLERAGRGGVPVLLPFALPRRWDGGGGGEAYVAALIRRAIGYHIKIDV